MKKVQILDVYDATQRLHMPKVDVYDSGKHEYYDLHVVDELKSKPNAEGVSQLIKLEDPILVLRKQ